METINNAAFHANEDGTPKFMDFHKSKRSQNTNCVQFGYRRLGGVVAETVLIDSKDPHGPAFVLTADEHKQLVGCVKAGVFDWPEAA